MVAATFRHIASRNLDPQLHTHAVIANMTRDAQGRWKSVEPISLHRNARLIGAFYRNELSRRLIEKGYSILPAMAGRIQSFEIAGYDKELRDAFSTRRSEILEYLEKEDLDYSQASTQIASYATRKRKAEPVRAMLETKWTERVREMGLATVPSVTRSRQPIVLPAVPSALEIVGRAMQHLEERQSVFAECELEALALGHSPGRHSIGEIRDAVEWMVADDREHGVDRRFRGTLRHLRLAGHAVRDVFPVHPLSPRTQGLRLPRPKSLATRPFDTGDGNRPRRPAILPAAQDLPCPDAAVLRQRPPRFRHAGRAPRAPTSAR